MVNMVLEPGSLIPDPFRFRSTISQSISEIPARNYMNGSSLDAHASFQSDSISGDYASVLR